MDRLTRAASGLTKEDYELLKSLSTPIKIQDYLNSIPFNYEKKGDTHMSPRRVLLEQKCHCIEGALLAATALWIQGEAPIIMNVSAQLGKGDCDHVITLYKRGGYWGAISKTNHSVLRFRDPIYRTPRELVLSYFHEWFINETRQKTLECYSKPLDMRRFGTEWITADEDLWHIADVLSELPHYYLVPKGHWRYVRKADDMELKAGMHIEWEKSDPRT
jgi:hypothetical protein